MKAIPESELILNPDGSVYHLHLRPQDIATTIITVGDPDRVSAVSKHFDRIEFKTQKREFVTHTGYIGNKRLSVISTGIGTDNIDIVFTELDALVNVDLETRIPKAQHTTLNIIRVGTSGGLQANVPLDGFLASSFGMGFDNLLQYYIYAPSAAEAELLPHLPKLSNGVQPYLAQASEKLLRLVGSDMHQGITATCSGFYGPQGRGVRLKAAMPNFLDLLQEWQYRHHQITNFEMETSAIYGLGKALGHHCLSLNVIVANRISKTFTPDGGKAVENLINRSLQIIADSTI